MWERSDVEIFAYSGKWEFGVVSKPRGHRKKKKATFLYSSGTYMLAYTTGFVQDYNIFPT